LSKFCCEAILFCCKTYEWFIFSDKRYDGVFFPTDQKGSFKMLGYKKAYFV